MIVSARTTQRLLWLFFISILIAGLTACGEPPTENPSRQPPQQGQTQFETVEQNGSVYQDTGRAKNSATPGSTSSDGARESANPPPSSPGAPSGRTGKVEEADLYRVSGNKLFYLNTYKGLTIFDLSNAKKPVKLSGVPVFGYPIEMFVEGNIVYALIKDALYLLKTSGKFEFHRRNASQLVTIDISNPKQPIVLQRLDIKGQLREGVSRKIDKTIYVVSYTPKYYWWGWRWEPRAQNPEQATVYSFNISNPYSIQTIQKLDLIKHPTVQNPQNRNQTQSYASDSFSGITISATSNTLLVGEKWRHSSGSRASGSRCYHSEYYQQTKMSIIDISDPKGKIRVHSRFTVRGELGDQFKQTYIYEKDKKRGIYLGIFRRQESKSQNCKHTRKVQNTIYSIDVSDGAHPRVLSAKTFGKPNETVRGSVFDRERKVAYAITAVRTDPLYAISFKNPEKLEILSEIDGLSGDINVFRFIGDKKFLMAIGRDNSSTCTGFGTDQSGTKVAVSIIDVRDLKNIRLVQRKCVAIEGGKWSHSAINRNLDQAHKMVGMYSDKKINIITLPVSYYAPSQRGNRWFWHEYKSAIGIMKWDLSKYDDTKGEKAQNVLENIATMQHPKGAVKRTIVTQLEQNGVSKRVVINLSDTHMSLIDLDDIQKPQLLSTYELAPYVRSIHRIGSKGKYVLERVTMGTSRYYNQYNEFRVKKADGTINDSPVLASFVVGRLQKVIQWNNLILLFRYHLNVTETLRKKYPIYDHQKSDVLIYDLSDPLKPKERGSVTLPYAFIPYYRFHCGGAIFHDFGYSNNHQSFIRTVQGLVSLRTKYTYKHRSSTQETDLFFLNVSNPDRPTFTQKSLGTSHYTTSGSYSNTRYHKLIQLSPHQFYVVSSRQIGTFKYHNRLFRKTRYYAQPWGLNQKSDGSFSWGTKTPINIPGRLIRAFYNGKGSVHFLTQDNDYIAHKVTSKNNHSYYQYQSIVRLYLLENQGSVARLKGFTQFKSWHLRGMLVDKNRLYISARRDGYYIRTHNKINDPSINSDNLLIYDIAQGTFKSLFSANTRTYNMQLMGVAKGNLFINLPGEGLLIANVQGKVPVGTHFKRTLGWVSHIEFDGDFALAASGHFGVYKIDLRKSTIPPM